ncbi:MAG: type IV pilus assembly protein PilM [Deltaproteobacteria bacterium]|nr:type IV pilus assembly protein PilM [Deltaproteobacteria bacterium]
MGLFGKKGKRVLGLDIGTSAIKFVDIKDTGRGYYVNNLGITPLPPETIVDGSLMDTTTVVEAIRELVSNYKIKKREVAISVSGHSVIVKKITLPKMTDSELEENIFVEAERYIPFDINDVNIDFQILSAPEKEMGEHMEVLLVAAKSDLIEDYIAIIREAGLSPMIIDIDSFALENMYELNYPLEIGDLVVLCDIGASIMNLNIVKGGRSLFTRDISIGGNLYTEEIQKELSVNFEEAEDLKLGGTSEKGSPHTIDKLLDKTSSTIALEIAKSLDFFTATFPEERITRQYLSGGCAKVPRLKQIVEEKLNVPVEICNPFANMTVNPGAFDSDYLQDIAPLMAISVGLALRKV